jgi:hypothetical protein
MNTKLLPQQRVSWSISKDNPNMYAVIAWCGAKFNADGSVKVIEKGKNAGKPEEDSITLTGFPVAEKEKWLKHYRESKEVNSKGGIGYYVNECLDATTGEPTGSIIIVECEPRVVKDIPVANAFSVFKS